MVQINRNNKTAPALAELQKRSFFEQHGDMSKNGPISFSSTAQRSSTKARIIIHLPGKGVSSLSERTWIALPL